MLELKDEHQKGVLHIAHERAEQINVHKHTPEIDSCKNKHGELIEGALYLLGHNKNSFPCSWSDATREKFDSKNRKQKLIVAGALIAAELDRIEFMENQPEDIDE